MPTLFRRCLRPSSETPLRCRPGTDAFTLIELVAVIAIAGLLAAIVIPVTGKVRAGARQTQCASNLRQVHAVTVLYAQENKGMFPYAQDAGYVSWYQQNSALAPYAGNGDTLQKIAVCPENLTGQPVPGPDPFGQYVKNDYGYPYVVSYLIFRTTSLGPRLRSNEIGNPAGTVLMADSHNGQGWGGPGFSPPPDPIWNRVAASHAGKTNLLWCDGHVSWQDKETARDRLKIN